MTSIKHALKTLELLNRCLYEAGHPEMAFLSTDGTDVWIELGLYELYDSRDYSHREGIDYADDEGYEPTLEVCIKTLVHHQRQLTALLESICDG